MRATRAGAFVRGATLLLACGPAALPSHDEGASSSGAPSPEPSTAETTAGGSGPVTAGASTTASASSGDDGTTHATSTTAADAGTSGGETGGRETGVGETTGEPPSACQQGCAVEFTCTTDWPSEEGCVLACEANLAKAAAFSPVCADAWENVSECVGTLTCEEYLEWRMPTTFPYPCVDADQGLAFECKGQ